MISFRYILLASVLLSLALCAPSDSDSSSDSTALAEKKAEKKSDSERAVDVINEDWMTYLANNYSGLAISGVAVLLIVGGLGYAFYHFYYLQHVLVPGTLGSTATTDQYGQPHSYQGGYSGYPSGYNQYATGRALADNPWNFTKVLEYIEIAQKTYEGFDWQDLNCQKRTLCELVKTQTGQDGGEMGRKLDNSYASKVLQSLDGIPMPQVIQEYLKQYKDAIVQGKNPQKDCGQAYPQCKFSIREVFNKAGKKKLN